MLEPRRGMLFAHQRMTLVQMNVATYLPFSRINLIGTSTTETWLSSLEALSILTLPAFSADLVKHHGVEFFEPLKPDPAGTSWTS